MKTLNFYQYLLEELAKEGYVEEDIVLVSNRDQTEFNSFSEFKLHADKSIHITYLEEDTCDDELIVIMEDTVHFHLKDGTIACYNFDQPDYSDSTYINNIKFIYSVKKLESKAIASGYKPESKLVIVGSYIFEDDISNSTVSSDKIVIDTIPKEPEGNRYILIGSSDEYAAEFNQDTGSFIFNTPQVQEEHHDAVIAWLNTIPSPWIKNFAHLLETQLNVKKEDIKYLIATVPNVLSKIKRMLK